MFQLSREEANSLRSQIVTLKIRCVGMGTRWAAEVITNCDNLLGSAGLKSQIAISKPGRGSRGDGIRR
jgi:hypothetical protein